MIELLEEKRPPKVMDEPMYHTPQCLLQKKQYEESLLASKPHATQVDMNLPEGLTNGEADNQIVAGLVTLMLGASRQSLCCRGILFHLAQGYRLPSDTQIYALTNETYKEICDNRVGQTQFIGSVEYAYHYMLQAYLGHLFVQMTLHFINPENSPMDSDVMKMFCKDEEKKPTKEQCEVLFSAVMMAIIHGWSKEKWPEGLQEAYDELEITPPGCPTALPN